MGAAIDFMAYKRRLRPTKPEPVSNEPLVEAAIQTRRMWVAGLALAFSLWGLELKDRGGASDDN